ncbi:MAG: HlyC/CorC family transporter [Deltaproteobacteria bacterium]|nr:HlyC/CorC family transporter [Deltaproteobacteria bacterium]
MPPVPGPSLLEALGVLGCLLVGVLLGAVDAAVSALPEPRARVLLERGGADGKAAARWLADSMGIRARLLVGRIACLITAATISATMAAHYGTLAEVAVAAAVVAVYSLLAEVCSTIARTRNATLAMPLLRWTRPLDIVFFPIGAPFAAIGRLVRDKVGRLFPPKPDEEGIVETEVAHVIDQGERSGAIDVTRAEMLRSVLEFRGTLTREVMVPRTRMMAVEVTAPIDEVMAYVAEHGHSRYPVYRQTLDNVIGILLAKDLFRVMVEARGSTPPPKSIAALVRRTAVMGVMDQPIADLLREMQAKHTHIAIVVDEYGGTAGMVTLEDILEEIVGEIHDEHDDVPPKYVEESPGTYVVDGSLSLRELEKVLGADMPQDDAYESIGGLVTAHLGEVPTVGTELQIDGFRVTVREADPKRVAKVAIARLRAEPEASA